MPLTDLPPVKDMTFSLKVNGEERQKASASEMLHSIDSIISYVSRFFSLRIGDLIFTGTPTGVGPVKEGDRLEAELCGHKLLDFDIK